MINSTTLISGNMDDKVYVCTVSDFLNWNPSVAT